VLERQAKACTVEAKTGRPAVTARYSREVEAAVKDERREWTR
jgi:hypothetical protein